MRSVTKQGIREARLKEIKEELLHSERLKVRWARAGLASLGGGGSIQTGMSHIPRSIVILEVGRPEPSPQGGDSLGQR